MELYPTGGYGRRTEPLAEARRLIGQGFTNQAQVYALISIAENLEAIREALSNAPGSAAQVSGTTIVGRTYGS